MRNSVEPFDRKAIVVVALVAATILFLVPSHAAAAANKSRAQQQAPAPSQTPSAEQPPSQSPSQPEPQIFDKPIPPAKLPFLNAFAGRTSAEIVKDKQFRKLIDTISPNAPIHVGHDRDISDALEMALSSPGDPARISDSRYLMISSNGSPKYPLRGFVWVDMQQGIALGGVYFHPTNGEPTPVLTVFSRQLKEKYLGMNDLPLAFFADLNEWYDGAGASPVATRYFVNASGSKYVLEHDEDFCSPPDGSTPPAEAVCEQMNADAADADMTAAAFMKATGHASDATAYMLDPQQIAWIQMRDASCRTAVDPIPCRTRMTRDRTRAITGRPSPPPRRAPPPHAGLGPRR
jgi:uncharacterized protein YecT (DUF1311 family)